MSTDIRAYVSEVEIHSFLAHLVKTNAAKFTVEDDRGENDNYVVTVYGVSLSELGRILAYFPDMDINGDI